MRKGKQKSGRGGGRLLPNSIRIIGSCLRNVSANASTVASTVRSASATVAASISVSSGDHKDQVAWAGFDKLELESSTCRHVLLLGYQNGFQILDVEDASNFSELVSKRDIGVVTFMQMLLIPLKSNSEEGFKRYHPLLLVVAEDETNNINLVKSSNHSGIVGGESPVVNVVNNSTVVRFYSLRSHSYIHDLRFRSSVCMVRCSPRIVAVGLPTQIHCYDALTLESKFSILTYPVPQVGGQGRIFVNVGYGPMALGHRWLAYASNNPPLLNTGWLSPKSASASKGTSPSTSPSSSSVVARYAVESGRHLAAGIVNLGDRGYKTISKYYQEHGSNSPTLLSTGSITSRPASTETDSAGVVVVKDCVSRAVISQFRAHSSPISALCFDPSGTLLVTASVHGNTINIFRIIPSNDFGSRSQSHDSCSSHIHLYKLHRGIRPVVIQDICFSHYSQWVAIVSSKGTCHVFVLSPFGGEVGFKVQNSQGEELSLSPVLTPPWWSTSTFSVNNLSFPPPPPPPPVSPVVVSRIRDNSSGLLNTVSNAAASVSGKSSVPSGALVAIFHNSLHGSHQQGLVGLKYLEHLLVFTPSGHVVQHEIRPFLGSEQSTDGSRAQSFTSAQVQDTELSVCVQPLQWWDVCRRSDLPEREECVSKIPFRRPELASFLVRDSNQSILDKENLETRSDEARNSVLKPDSSSSHERIHWYLSNAEVQYNTGRLPVWQNPKISFCMMIPSRLNGFAFGEFEIEKFPVSQIEIRWKDLLPVSDHFHSLKSAWNERGLSGGRSAAAYPSESRYQKDRPTEETIISHSKPASLSSTESSDGGSSRRMENLIDLDHINTEKPFSPISHTPKDFYHDKQGSMLDGLSLDEKFGATVSMASATQQTRNHFLGDAFFVQDELSSRTGTPSLGRTNSEGPPLLNRDVIYKLPLLVAEDADASYIHSDKAAPLPSHDSLGLLPCAIQDLCDEKLEMIRGEKSKEDVEAPDDLYCGRDLIQEEEKEQKEDDMLGGMFAFSQEA